MENLVDNEANRRVWGNPVLGFRVVPLEGANFVNFFEESERERLELKERMKKEREERGIISN